MTQKIYFPKVAEGFLSGTSAEAKVVRGFFFETAESKAAEGFLSGASAEAKVPIGIIDALSGKSKSPTSLDEIFASRPNVPISIGKDLVSESKVPTGIVEALSGKSKSPTSLGEIFAGKSESS